MKLMAIDPGGNTGIVYGDFELRSDIPSHEIVKGLHTVVDIDCSDPYDGFDELDCLINAFKPDEIICENFQLWTVAADLTPVQLITLLNYRLGSICMQEPSERNVITDARLKAWDLWYSGRKDVNAAMKHLLVWIRKNQNSFS